YRLHTADSVSRNDLLGSEARKLAGQSAGLPTTIVVQRAPAVFGRPVRTFAGPGMTHQDENRIRYRRVGETVEHLAIKGVTEQGPGRRRGPSSTQRELPV